MVTRVLTSKIQLVALGISANLGRFLVTNRALRVNDDLIVNLAASRGIEEYLDGIVVPYPVIIELTLRGGDALFGRWFSPTICRYQ